MHFLGGSAEVGRLGMVLDVDGTRLLFDYGIAPTDPPKYPVPAPAVDAALLSHAHLDHSGMMAALAGDQGVPIYSTGPTRPLTELLARDSLKVCRIEGYPQPYSMANIETMSEVFETVPLLEDFEVGSLSIHGESAGHIPGSAMFVVDGGRNRVVFTGDINVIDTNLMKGARPVDCDTLVIESTYSGREHPDRKTLQQRFLARIGEVRDAGGVVIVPAFATGRTQELLMMLAGSGYEVWLDGMGKQVTEMMLDDATDLRDARALRKAAGEANFVTNPHKRHLAMSGDVIVTTSGMLEGGPVLNYIERFHNDPKSAIFMTGYQVRGTNGRMLIDDGVIEIRGVKEKVNCQVEFFDFSAHAGHDELVRYIEECGPKRVVLFHGDSREPLADDLRKRGFDVLLPQTGEMMDIG
jgi:putative mRNA 3-end processing factor